MRTEEHVHTSNYFEPFQHQRCLAVTSESCTNRNQGRSFFVEQKGNFPTGLIWCTTNSIIKPAVVCAELLIFIHVRQPANIAETECKNKLMLKAKPAKIS